MELPIEDEDKNSEPQEHKMIRQREFTRKIAPGMKLVAWKVFLKLSGDDRDFVYDHLDSLEFTRDSNAGQRSGWLGKDKKWIGKIHWTLWQFLSPKARVGLIVNHFVEILNESEDGPYGPLNIFRGELKVLADLREAIEKEFPLHAIKNHPNGNYENYTN